MAETETLARYPPPPQGTRYILGKRQWKVGGSVARCAIVDPERTCCSSVEPVRENVPASQLETNGLLHNRGRHKAAWVEVERREEIGKVKGRRKMGGGGIAGVVEYIYPFLC